MTDPTIPQLVTPSLEEQHDIIQLVDAINLAFTAYSVDTVMGVLSTLAIAGYSGAALEVRPLIIEDVRVLLRVLEAIGDETDHAAIGRCIASVIPNSLFTKHRPAGNTVQ